MDSTHMRVLGRSGILALCAVAALTGVLRAPRSAAMLPVQAAENSAHAGRMTVPQAEIVVSVGRFSLSWLGETGALYWELRKLAVEFCFCASELGTVDDTTCRSAFDHHVRLAVVRPVPRTARPRRSRPEARGPAIASGTNTTPPRLALDYSPFALGYFPAVLTVIENAGSE